MSEAVSIKAATDTPTDIAAERVARLAAL